MKNAASRYPDKAAEMERLLRSIVDVDEVSARNERYNKASFKRWREVHKASGNYEELMARIFSGWDHLTPEDIRPWTDADEAKVKSWLGET